MASSASRFLFSVFVKEVPRTPVVDTGAEALRLAVDEMAAPRALNEMVSWYEHSEIEIRVYL